MFNITNRVDGPRKIFRWTLYIINHNSQPNFKFQQDLAGAFFHETKLYKPIMYFLKTIFYNFFFFLVYMIINVQWLINCFMYHYSFHISINIYCTVGCPKKWKFCDSGQMMGEVTIKCFYFYYFRFRQLFKRAMLKNQNQKIHCALNKI